MENQPYISYTDKPTTFINGKELAELLNVSPPSLSQAVKQGHNCGGYPVTDWAVKTDSGRIKGYNVPEFLLSGDQQQEEQQRANPDRQTPNEPNLGSNEGDNPSGLAKLYETYNNYSALPEGQDYIRPVSMASLTSALKKALERDTPQTRAVIAALLGMMGAITGHAVTDNAVGAGVGARTGIGVAMLIYKYLEPNPPQANQLAGASKLLNEMALDMPTGRSNQSGYHQDQSLYIT